jgi:UDP-GlcNAc3NAcA epimerase
LKKVVTIVGARPQFIKAATVSRVVATQNEIEEVVVHTGQHYDANMSEIFFEQLAIPTPNFSLGIGGGPHGAMTGRQLEKIEEVLLSERPDWVLVYGDTNSTLAGSLAAAKLHIPVAHVEAGLRSFNRRMPEEINRVLADHVSTLLFAPTAVARENLLAEGIVEEAIHVVGDVMYDAALFYKERSIEPKWFSHLNVGKGDYVLCTIHRAENTNDPERLAGILKGLADYDRAVILPLHPRTQAKIDDLGLSIPKNVRVTEPVGYLEMIWLEMHCRAVATDSGGVQKEAFFHGKPCVTLRDETEWVELLELGVNQLAATNPTRIRNSLRLMTEAKLDFSSRPYGLGDASVQVVEAIARQGS